MNATVQALKKLRLSEPACLFPASRKKQYPSPFRPALWTYGIQIMSAHRQRKSLTDKVPVAVFYHKID